MFVAERLTACLTLVSKFHERLLEIYGSFKLAMQSGAFIQLILTLAAIAARIDALVPEFQDVIRMGWKINHRILQILDPGQASSIKPIHVDHVGAHNESIPAAIVLSIEMSHDDVGLSEDVGNFVTWPNIYSSQNISSHEPTVPETDAIIDPLRFVDVVNDEPSQTIVSGRFDVERRVIQGQPNKMSKHARKAEKAKKMTRNEIDVIFGL